MSNNILDADRFTIYRNATERTFFLKIYIPFALFFGTSSYLSDGLNESTLLVVIALISLGVFAWRNAEIEKKQSIILNKTTEKIEIYGVSFFGKPIYKAFPLSQFNAVQSYNSMGGRNTQNLVELLTLDRSRGLVIDQFCPGVKRNFLTPTAYTENQLAGDLAKQICVFLSIKNLGFIGHKSNPTTRMGIEEDAELIKKILH